MGELKNREANEVKKVTAGAIIDFMKAVGFTDVHFIIDDEQALNNPRHGGLDGDELVFEGGVGASYTREEEVPAFDRISFDFGKKED